MIALDAMGGDLAPRVAVNGAINAARRGIAITLFGDELQLLALLEQKDNNWQQLPLSVVGCSQVVSMDDEPTKAIRKKDSSLVRAVQSVVDGETQAIVSAGNSGACLVTGTFLLGRAKGVKRPAIGNFLPTQKGSVFCIDLGANADCKPEYLEQFAQMGSVFVSLTKNKLNPFVGLLSNGAEAYKGSSLIKKAYTLLEQLPDIHFVGNIEARDVFSSNVDVIVCDGFSGNILLKTLQGAAGIFRIWLEQEATKSWLRKLYFFIGLPIFNSFKKRMTYSRHGGALLLGLNFPFIVAHGNSCELAIENAIIQADQVIGDQFIQQFNNELSKRIDSKVPLTKTVSQKIRSLFGGRNDKNV